MKRFLLIVVAGLMLTSCSFQSYQCPAYGHHKLGTKHGAKAQNKYARRKV
jgi:hypothetical protein